MATQQKKTDKPKPADAIPAKSSGSAKWLLPAIVIVVVTFFSLSPVMKNSFINQDDGIYVYQDTNLSKPLPEAVSFFFGPHYFSGNYIPLTMTVYALEYNAAGMTPEYYHTVNLFLHLCNVLLVFWFIYLLSRKKPLVASIVALFFGIHPMHVESVAWVAELKDVLYTFFFIAGLIAYYKYIEQKDKKNALRFPVIVFILFALAVLSKPAAIIFPIVLLLLDFYTGRKFDKWVWIEKLPFFIISFIFGVIAIKAQQADDLINNSFSIAQKIPFAAYSLLCYVVKFLLPVNLSFFYPYPSVASGHLPYLYYISLPVVILLFYGIYKTLKYSRLIAFGTLFFLVNILLVLQFITLGNSIIADRYTYIPYIGLFFIVAMGFDWLYHNNDQRFNKYKNVAITIVAFAALACIYISYNRCQVWENEDTMATDVLSKYPNDHISLNNKGYLLFTQGKYQESINFFIKAVQAKPDYVKASINLKDAYLKLKDYNDALIIIDTALKYTPQDYYLLNAKGKILSLQNNCTDAIKLFKAAIQVKNNDAIAYLNLSDCYFNLRDYDNAINTIAIALRYAPDNYVALNNMGYYLFLEGRYNQALKYYKASLNIKPDYTIASGNLANCYRAINDSTQTNKGRN